ncbi:MAG: hypothetical protein NT150_08610 [Bacteroidetes bacterium]|nr:hypothetical protein [Bacteroidota bacterium]
MRNIEYTSKQILALAAAIQGDSEASDWLESQRPELYYVHKVVTNHSYGACDQLKEKGCDIEYMFAVAFLEDFQTSIDYFLKKEELVWAAVLDTCRDNETALIWLEKKHPPYKVLADAILDHYRYRRNLHGHVW